MQILNIELEERVDYTVSFSYTDKTTNLPVDITRFSAIMEVRPTFGSPDVFLSFSAINGRIILGGATGIINIRFLPEDTDQSLLYTGWTKAAYDLILSDTQNKRTKLLKGFVTISRTASI